MLCSFNDFNFGKFAGMCTTLSLLNKDFNSSYEWMLYETLWHMYMYILVKSIYILTTQLMLLFILFPHTGLSEASAADV